MTVLYILIDKRGFGDYMIGMCMRSKNPSFEFECMDWGLHYYPKIIDNKNIIGYHAPIVDIGNPKNTNALNTLKNIIDKIDGHSYLTIHLHNGGSNEPDFDTLLNNISELNDYAKKKNINLCIENLRKGFSSNPDNVIKVADYADCYITFDIGHTNYRDRINFIDLFSDRIYNVHVYDIELDDIGHVPPKNIEVLRPVLDRLLDHKCDFWLVELMKYDECMNTKNMLKEYLENHK
ncbi:MAG: hypothetical protein PWP15_1598 [Methanothermococcus sp.]|jgi:sugar phosphate isomerase/epimerase|nr:hypothetical protein [Methanothermococcus sp.]MDK2988119.1 hypothetical protein [Methanothermococcus sp.]